jgi:transposase
MKNQDKFIGIDVSKDTLDICVYLNGNQFFFEIKNKEKDICDFFDKELPKDIGNAFVCIENTGKYSWKLMHIIPKLDCLFYVVNPLHLKRSLGLIRGKSDKIDASRIALFIKKNHQELQPFIERREQIESLQVLLSERKHRVKMKAQLQTKNKDLDNLANLKLKSTIKHQNNLMIRRLGKQIALFEQQIKELIKQDETLKNINKQMLSIPGVGQITSWNMIVKTNEFKSITEPRKMACYCGVAPFQNTSGTSVFGRNRVSLMADKDMKKLLHLGAMSAIRLKNDLRAYYIRKVGQGKNKMAVLNAVRNKIIHLIFAIVKSGNLYQNRLVLS